MKFLKATLSLILALTMVFSCCSAALAAEYNYDHYPMIYLAGFGDTNIYYEDDPEKKPLFFPLDAERIVPFAFKEEEQTFYDKIIELFKKIISATFGFIREILGK